MNNVSTFRVVICFVTMIVYCQAGYSRQGLPNYPVWPTKLGYSVAYQKFLHPLLRDRCSQCHAGVQGRSGFAAADLYFSMWSMNSDLKFDQMNSLDGFRSGFADKAKDGHCGEACLSDVDFFTARALLYEYGYKEIRSAPHPKQFSMDAARVELFFDLLPREYNPIRLSISGLGEWQGVEGRGSHNLEGVELQVNLEYVLSYVSETLPPFHIRISNPRLLLTSAGQFKIRGIKVKVSGFPHPSQGAWESIDTTINFLSSEAPLSTEPIIIPMFSPYPISVEFTFDEFRWTK